MSITKISKKRAVLGWKLSYYPNDRYPENKKTMQESAPLHRFFFDSQSLI